MLQANDSSIHYMRSELHTITCQYQLFGLKCKRQWPPTALRCAQMNPPAYARVVPSRTPPSCARGAQDPGRFWGKPHPPATEKANRRQGPKGTRTRRPTSWPTAPQRHNGRCGGLPPHALPPLRAQMPNLFRPYLLSCQLSRSQQVSVNPLEGAIFTIVNPRTD